MNIRKLWLVSVMKNEFGGRLALTFDYEEFNKHSQGKKRRPVILFIGNENEPMKSFEERCKNEKIN